MGFLQQKLHVEMVTRFEICIISKGIPKGVLPYQCNPFSGSVSTTQDNAKSITNGTTKGFLQQKRHVEMVTSFEVRDRSLFLFLNAQGLTALPLL